MARVLHFWLMMGSVMLLALLGQGAKKARWDGTLAKSSQQQQSESEEDSDGGMSTMDSAGMKGLAGAGISYTSQATSQTVPKCLGQDIRMDKIIQVSEFCENESAEGKNETMEAVPKSLCFTACIYKYIGLIGEDMMFTSGISTVVVDLFPAAAHIQAKKAFRSCAKQTVLPLSMADNCASFGPLRGCILRNVQNFCNGVFY